MLQAGRQAQQTGAKSWLAGEDVEAVAANGSANQTPLAIRLRPRQ